MARRPLSLKEMEQKYLAPGAAPVSVQLLGRLQRDPRAGVQKLREKLQKRLDRERKERERLEAMLHFETVLWRAGVEKIAGVDEVGIGPMAGPVVSAAVVFPPDTRIDGVDDSKRLDAETRQVLDVEIREAAAHISIGVVSPAEIDRLNIYHAGIRAMRIAVLGLAEPPQHVLVDSRVIPDLPQPQNSFNKGDGLSFSIASASIVAKVYRDRLMLELDRTYPGYGFASHKGYCTPAHQQAVRERGPCPIHRRSFDYIRELQGKYGEPFYALKTKAQQASSPAELEAWEEELRKVRDQLSDNENRKLRILAGRRWKRIR